jgi:hypothetical protein
MEITEDLQPVYRIVGYQYGALLRSWTKRERAYKISGVKTKRGKKRILLERTQRGGNSISINFLKENIFSVFSVVIF